MLGSVGRHKRVDLVEVERNSKKAWHVENRISLAVNVPNFSL
jgi:hypothetical protein